MLALQKIEIYSRTGNNNDEVHRKPKIDSSALPVFVAAQNEAVSGRILIFSIDKYLGRRDSLFPVMAPPKRVTLLRLLEYDHERFGISLV